MTEAPFLAARSNQFRGESLVRVCITNLELGVSPDLSPVRIPVLKDYTNTREVIKEALVEARYMVETAPQADEALRRIDIFAPTLVLTDHEMPGLTGLEMLARIEAPNVLDEMCLLS